jgi:hypothetical protein
MDSMDNFRERLEALEHQIHTLARQARWWRRIACGLLLVGLVSLPLPSGIAQDDPAARETKSLRQRVEALQDKIAALQATLTAVTFDSTTNEVVITRANLRIVNGLGSTETTNGLGNLIVGYNESNVPFNFRDDRSGSHNVVVGERNNFSSFGGLVVDLLNEISGQFTSVSGGNINVATGTSSSISGGARNITRGDFSSISGGALNTASGGSNRSAPGTENWAAGALFSDH